VGLNAHLLSLTQTYRGAGINGYIVQLLRRLPALRPAPDDLAYTAFLHDMAFAPPAGLMIERSRWDTRRPARRILWEQTRLAALSGGVDLLHGLAFVAPLLARCPTMITVHDLSFLRFPNAFRPFNRTYLALATRASVRRARCVIAVSESTRQDVIALLGAPPDKVVVVYNGVTEAFSPAPAPQAVEQARQLGLPERYILYVGTLEPRKNLVRLLDAYAALRRRSADAPPLVIAGGKGWYYEEIERRVDELDLGQQVIFPGFVPAEDLPWLYRGAALFVYPSIFEGFGLPVLEAMACGAPVITSTVSSLPEVAGDAALLVDPEDTEGLADAMHRALCEPGLAEALRAAGIERARRFSWDHTAAETAGHYRRALEMRGAAA
jgi:glycosyltransferase involved in cell wall biosynthesis